MKQQRPQIQYENWPRWFAMMWPNAQRRWLIVTSYRQFAQTHKTMFADILLRLGVWTPNRESDPFLAGVAEGRRQSGLELVKLAALDPVELFELTKIERQQTGGRT